MMAKGNYSKGQINFWRLQVERCSKLFKGIYLLLFLTF